VSASRRSSHRRRERAARDSERPCGNDQARAWGSLPLQSVGQLVAGRALILKRQELAGHFTANLRSVFQQYKLAGARLDHSILYVVAKPTIRYGPASDYYSRGIRMRLVISATLLLLFCGAATAEQCNALIDKYNRSLNADFNILQADIDRHLEVGSCENETAVCEMHRALANLARQRLALVDPMFNACGKTIRLTVSGAATGRLDSRKKAQDDLSRAEGDVALHCAKAAACKGGPCAHTKVDLCDVPPF